MYQVFQEREQPCDTNIDTAECHVETEGHQFFSTLERSILFPCVKQDHWLNMSRSPSFYVTWEIFFSHFLPHIRAAFLTSTPPDDATRPLFPPPDLWSTIPINPTNKSISVLGESMDPCVYIDFAINYYQSNQKE